MPITSVTDNSFLEKLSYMFRFDLEEGHIYWVNPPKYHKDLIGKEAGNKQPGTTGKTYWVVQIDGKKYRRGRLLFYCKYGRFPFPCLDHINGNSLDDRISNIREATIIQNAWNHKHRKRTLKLPMGVRIINKSGNYEARISCNKKQYHLGSYKTPEEAQQVYLKKRKELYADFS
jgi:hypothetical protein